MENSISTNLCKGLRACGIPKNEANQILNIVENWLANNGSEWTNARIKDLRQWYETFLAGKPVPPEWFRHSKTNLPLGIWKWVFNLPIPKALGVLSLNTVLYEQRLSPTQKKKFLHGLEGNRNPNPAKLLECVKRSGKQIDLHLKRKMPEIHFPTVFDMTGSIPIHDGHNTVRPENKLGEALKALELSWDSVPQVTFDFLLDQGLEGYMPINVLGNIYQLELQRPHDSCVGRVSVLQQPQLKARIVGNPNRITQVTLEPLKRVYMTALRKLPTDVTHCQEDGIAWVQEQLKQGKELAGSDLTSASDLLDVRLCLALVNATFGFTEIAGYQEYIDYFQQVSRAPWYCPALKQNVSWKQGDVLGTGPSFGLLSLTNNAAAFAAFQIALQEGALPPDAEWQNSFRVVGDDIVMLSEMEKYYSMIIESLGGEINHSKTLTSNRVAEFAGRVITSDASYLKAIKYAEPSDSSFMSYMAQLGDQAKHFLMPRQRQCYDLLKEVPGIVVNGPWMPDSYGIPLGDRYAWYLQEVEPALKQAKPDLDLEDYQLLLLKAKLSLEEAGKASNELLSEPLLDDSGYLPEQVTPTFKVGGDPRLTNGKTTLEVLYQHVKSGDITPFDKWKSQGYASSSLFETDDGDTHSQTSSSSNSSLKDELMKLINQKADNPLEEKTTLESDDWDLDR